jgi:predicted neuraminidase
MKALHWTVASLCVLAWTATAQPTAPRESKEIVITVETNIDTHRTFGSEHPGLYKHPVSITELANGDLYISYYGGEKEYSEGTAVYGSRLRAGQTKWTPPVVIADTPFRGDGNPVVWQAPDGIVWLFYVNRYGETWSTARVKGKVSKDGGETWSDSFMLTLEEGTMCRGKPIVLNNGDYLLPMYFEAGSDKEWLDAATKSYFLRYDVKKKTWSETNRITSKEGNLQPQVVQLTDDHLICYMRRGGGYGPDTKGYILKSESKDGGYTWSDGVDTEFPNPNAAIDVLKLQSGKLLLVYNNHNYNRSPLTVAVSDDDGKTWPWKRDIGGGHNSFAYPYAIETKDGMIHIIYTTNGRSTIMRAVFQEEAITKFGIQH